MPRRCSASTPSRVIAGKLETIVSFGFANGWLKDYFDLHPLAKSFDFDGSILARAVRATPQRRSTPLPEGLPAGFTSALENDRQKQAPWTAFLRRDGLTPISLHEVVTALALFFEPVLMAARRQ